MVTLQQLPTHDLSDADVTCAASFSVAARWPWAQAAKMLLHRILGWARSLRAWVTLGPSSCWWWWPCSRVVTYRFVTIPPETALEIFLATKFPKSKKLLRWNACSAILAQTDQPWWPTVGGWIDTLSDQTGSTSAMFDSYRSGWDFFNRKSWWDWLKSKNPWLMVVTSVPVDFPMDQSSPI